MQLVSIPASKYEDYRLKLMFQCYKWDPQFLDNNTIAKYALVITEEENKNNSIIILTKQGLCDKLVEYVEEAEYPLSP